MQLNPGEQFGINWNVSDPSDTNVYYPQAIIQNSRTMDVVKTLDMTSSDNIMYHVLWKVPQDGSGMGFHVIITIKVYTDSGHTTLSQNYQIESKTYLVQERPTRNLGLNYGGGDGGLQIGDIRNAIKEFTEPLNNKLLPVEKPKELSRITILESLLTQLCESITYNEEKKAEETEKLTDKLKEYDENTAKMLKYISELDKQNADAYDAMVKIVKEHAKGSKKYIDDQISSFGDDLMKEIRGVFDNVQVIQITEGGKGLKKLAESVSKEDPMEKYHKIAQKLL